MREKQWCKLDADPQALGTSLIFCYSFFFVSTTTLDLFSATAIETSPKQVAIHLALSAYASLAKKQRPNAPCISLLPPSTTFEYAVGEVYVYMLNY